MLKKKVTNDKKKKKKKKSKNVPYLEINELVLVPSNIVNNDY